MNCLTEMQLEKLLQPESHADQWAWELHVGKCTGCQERLERRAIDANVKTMVLKGLADVGESISTESFRQTQKFESTFFYAVKVDEQDSDHNETDPNDDESFGRLDKTRLAKTQESGSLQYYQHLLNSPRHPENLGRIDRYEIERLIGTGGMGIVFKGFDAELNRPVAVKILSPHLSSNGTARQRFTREAKSAAAVVHDHVVPIFDIQSENERPFIVMPFINGVSLQEHVDERGQVDCKDILQVGLQVASGLSKAHDLGIIHRDIKPANILLQNGLSRVQITDFGLARAADDAAMTNSGMIAGTPHYMSPEQSRGQVVDHRSDLYSLGSVLYFLATGRTVYRGDGPFSIMAQVSKGNYIPVRELNSEIPLFLADIIDRLLETEPKDRFQTADQLVQHLKRALAYQQQPTKNRVPNRLWSSRHQKRAMRLAIGGFAILSLFLVAAFMFSQNKHNSANQNDMNHEEFANHSILLTPSGIDQRLDALERELSELEQRGSRSEWTESPEQSNPFNNWFEQLNSEALQIRQLLESVDTSKVD